MNLSNIYFMNIFYYWQLCVFVIKLIGGLGMFDLHIHSTFSDGSDNVDEIIEKVKQAGIDYFSITDHDTALSARYILNNKNVMEKIKTLNLKYVTGIEWTCRFGKHNVHILGYDYDPEMLEIKYFENQAKELLKEKHNYRMKKLQEMGYNFSDESLKVLNSKVNVRTLDVANALISDGYFSDLQDAVKNAVHKVKYEKKYKLDGKELIKTLSNVGVKLVWAHSIREIGGNVRTFEEVEEILKEMKELGLSGLECYYSLYSEEENAKLANLAKKMGLFITCGSDYHGKNKTVKLAQTSCDGSKTKDEDILVDKIFRKTIG